MDWRSRDVLRAAALVLALSLAAKLIWFAYPLFFVVFLGVLFGLAVSNGVDRLERFRIPRGISAAVIVFGTIALIGAIGAWSAPTIRTQSKELRTKLPEAIDNIEAWVAKRQGGILGAMLGLGDDAATAATGAAGAVASGAASPDGLAEPTGRASAEARQNASEGAAADSARAPAAGASKSGGAVSRIPDRNTDRTPDRTPDRPGDPPADSVSARAAAAGAQAAAPSGAQGAQGAQGAAPAGGRLREKVLGQFANARRFIMPAITSTIAALGALLMIIFMAIYIAADPDTYHRGMMHLFPHRARNRAGEVLSAISLALRKWLVAQLIAMLVIGAVTTGALLLLGVKAALPLGILAGLFEFIPTVGPILSSIPAIAMGFVDSPEKALTVALVSVAIQFAENHLLIPILMKESVDLPPALTIFAQALMALIFGFPGLLVAVPLLAVITVTVKMLYVQDVVGDDIEVLDGEKDEDDK